MKHPGRPATVLAFITLLFLTRLLPVSKQPPEPTSTGFYWPTGTSDIGDYAGWLADSCSWSEKPTYFDNLVHIGWDIKAEKGSPVYAIADGTVTLISTGGKEKNWGEGNVAVLVEHQLADGTPFIAVYGHVRSEVTRTVKLEGGKPFATIGPLSKPHLHFGIRPGPSTTIPHTNLGRIPCPKQGPITDTNGFVDPINWITTLSPPNTVEILDCTTKVETALVRKRPWQVQHTHFLHAYHLNLPEGYKIFFAGEELAIGQDRDIDGVNPNQDYTRFGISPWWANAHIYWRQNRLWQFCFPTGRAIGSGNISGQVKTLDKDKPVRSASVEFLSQGTTISTTTTSNDGRFLFTNVPAGSATIRAANPEIGQGGTIATVLTNQDTQANILLVPNPNIWERFWREVRTRWQKFQSCREKQGYWPCFLEFVWNKLPNWVRIPILIVAGILLLTIAILTRPLWGWTVDLALVILAAALSQDKKE